MTFFSKSGLTCRKISKMTWEYLTNTYLGICDPKKSGLEAFLYDFEKSILALTDLLASVRGELASRKPVEGGFAGLEMALSRRILGRFGRIRSQMTSKSPQKTS